MVHKFVTIGDDTTRLIIWDTSGNPRFNLLIKSYYRGVKAVLFVYDCTSEASFNSINRYLNDC